ncbi:uncharacterized protein LOC133746539 [Rosa rugosa]|uniref:uncharacterized protein LOC133746539 n=1 Tax=Rosa rugosa TaxID=74645 RepID=UPI002B40DE12|nr:uncharacterized protein LOC133746539 [Rosa rugosa]
MDPSSSSRELGSVRPEPKSFKTCVFPFSPPTPTTRWNNDVFLSFRGEDIPESFTEHLLRALDQKGISTIQGEPREPMGPSDFKPIEESICAIVIFSPNFANSTWCLDGLAKAVECMRKPEGIVPVFYDVDDGDVKNQRGSFGEAFSQLEQRFKADPARIRKWRSALKSVGHVSGWYPRKSRDEGKSIQEIVEKVVIELAAQKKEQLWRHLDDMLNEAASKSDAPYAEIDTNVTIEELLRESEGVAPSRELMDQMGSRSRVLAKQHQFLEIQESARLSPRASTGAVGRGVVNEPTGSGVEVEISVDELVEEVERCQIDTSVRARLVQDAVLEQLDAIFGDDIGGPVSQEVITVDSGEAEVTSQAVGDAVPTDEAPKAQQVGEGDVGGAQVAKIDPPIQARLVQDAVLEQLCAVFGDDIRDLVSREVIIVDSGEAEVTSQAVGDAVPAAEAPMAQRVGEGDVGGAQVAKTDAPVQVGGVDGIRVSDTCAPTDGARSREKATSQLRLGSPPVGVAVDPQGRKKSRVEGVARSRSTSGGARDSRDEVAEGLARTLGEIGITDGAILHMVADLRHCHRDRSRVNAEDPRLGYREAQERLMRAVNMNYQASAELIAHFDQEIARLQGELNVERERAREPHGALDRGQVEREEMRRAIDDGITRRMELEQSLAMEGSRRREAEDAVAPLRKSNLDLTCKLQRAEVGLKALEEVRAQAREAEERMQDLERQVSERDAELELRDARLLSLDPYPDRVLELEGQVGTLQREIDRLRNVECQAGQKDAELEQLRKELVEQRHDHYLLSSNFQEKINKAFSDGALHSIRDGIAAGWIDKEKMVSYMQVNQAARLQTSAASGGRGGGIVIREHVSS